jgi:hypothetical protein
MLEQSDDLPGSFPTMTMTTLRWTLALSGLCLLASSPDVRAADDAKTVDAGGLTFATPSTWKSSTPSSAMRRAQLKIDPATGDTEPAELIVFAFPGGAGGVDANVQRWEKTFKDKEGNNPKADVKKVKGQNTDVTRVELSGHYYPTTFPGQPKQADHDGYRLLGAIVTTDETGYFLRLVGPEKTVTAAKADFDKLVASLKVGGK